MSALVFTAGILILSILLQPLYDRVREVLLEDAIHVAGVLDFDDGPIRPHAAKRADGPLDRILVADDHGHRRLDRLECVLRDAELAHTVYEHFHRAVGRAAHSFAQPEIA